MRIRKNMILAAGVIIALAACFAFYAHEAGLSITYSKDEEIAGINVPNNSFVLSIHNRMHDYLAESFIYNWFDHDTICYFLPSFSEAEEVKVIMKEGVSAQIETMDGNNVDIHSGDSCDKFPINETFRLRFTGADGASTDWCDTCIYLSELPTVFVDTDSGSLDYINYDKNNREQAELTLIDSNGKLVYKDRIIHITGRGNQTWDYEKKSYSLKLKEKKNLFGMGKAKDWILLSNVVDDTYMRNKITYDMAEEAGMAFSSESCYVDVYMNGVYHGMYMLCEKIEADPQRVAIANLDDENCSVNRVLEKEDRDIIEEGKYKYADYTESPTDITGGYIVERDCKEKYAEGLSGFTSDFSGDSYTLKSPEYATSDEIEYIDTLFENMERAVFARDGINPDTGRTFSDYIDLESFAKKFIIEEITMNNGAGATSSYFYKPIDAVSTKVHAGPVWDYDKGYGNGYDQLDNSNRAICCQTLYKENTLLYWALFQHEEFRTLVKTYYRDFFSEYLQELIDYRIDEYVDILRISAEMDRARWTYIYPDRWYQFHGDDYNESVEYLRHFIIDRKSFLDEVWIDEVPLCSIRMDDDMDTGSMLVDDSNSAFLCTGNGHCVCIFVKKDEEFDKFPSFNQTTEYLAKDIDTGETYKYDGPGLIVDRDIRLLVEINDTDGESARYN